MVGGGKVGNAYLLVTPKLSDDGGSKIAASGAKTGASYGSGFSSAAKGAIGTGVVAIGNILSNAITSVASNVGQVFKDMFANYANYEQLVGGVDTLFKESSSIVQKNAANAFKTAGMSANEYMENVTSFSASLLQGLGGDTEAAAAYADTAMRDMSDNANKMGTDMSLITNAYQGFAKQNYTMLDNLKLGYGGTKTEMERLLSDASKIAGVEFNIDNYQDVIEAIHVMQTSMDISGYSVDELSQKLSDMSLTSDEVQKVADDMGISYEEAMKRMQDGTLTARDAQVLLGTTAKEAEMTISGSLGMMKASWENFLTGILDENADMGELFGQLVHSIEAVALNLIPRFAVLFSRMFQELPLAALNAIISLPDTMLPALQSVFGEQMGTAISENMRSAIEFVTAGVTELMTSITTAIQPVVDNIVSLIQAAMPIVMSVVGDAMTFISSIVQAVWPVVSAIISGAMNAISGVITTIWPALQNIITNVMNAIMNVERTVWPAISNLVSTVMGIIQGVINVAWPAIQAIVSTVMSAILGVISTVWPAIEGIVTVAANVIQTIITTASGAIRAITEDVWPAIQGTISSVMGAIQGVIDTVWGVIQGIVEGATSAISGAIDGMSSIVGGVTSTFEAVKSAIEGPINMAKDIVQGAISTIEGIITGANLQLPSIPLPHFNIDGGEAPWGIGGAGRAPTFDVSWYARGGFVDGATLIGAGEAGPEMILPKSGGLMDDFADAVSANVSNADVVEELRRLRREIGPIIADYAPSMTQREFGRMARGAVAYG